MVDSHLLLLLLLLSASECIVLVWGHYGSGGTNKKILVYGTDEEEGVAWMPLVGGFQNICRFLKLAFYFAYTLMTMEIKTTTTMTATMTMVLSMEALGLAKLEYAKGTQHKKKPVNIISI